jgi:group I intron endonuclease
MTSKLTKSKIQVSGKIVINLPGREHNGLEVNLNPLKQSKSGVYEILNKFNGKRYIGNSKSMVIRKQHHISDLNWNRHKSKELQNDFNDAQKTMCSFDDVFEFNVIIYCEVSELEFWERLLIDNLHPEYNTKKKKQIPPKKFDIDGNKIENDPMFDFILGNKTLEEATKETWDEDDCEQEIM